jgi:hypothetical protein
MEVNVMSDTSMQQNAEVQYLTENYNKFCLYFDIM